MLKLYEFTLSGHSHKARMMLSMLGLAYESVLLNGAAREQKTASYLALNPFGQVPVLQDGDLALRDSQSILVYLARRYGAAHWLPLEPAALAEVSAWLATAGNEIVRGPGALRLHHKFGRGLDIAEARQITDTLLPILDTHLKHRTWLATQEITIADLAAFPYLALAAEGDVDLSPFPAIIAWLARIQATPGFVTMPGMPTFTA